MIDYIQGGVIVLIEAYCFVLFVDSLYESICEKNIYLKLFRLLLLTGCSFVISSCLYNNVLLRLAVLVLVSSLIHKYFNKQSYIKNIVVSAIYIGLIMIIDYISISIYSTIVPNYAEYIEVIQPIIVILSKSILLLVVLFIKRVIDRKNIILLSDADWLKFLFFPIFTVLVIIIIVYNSEAVINNELELFLWVIACGLVGIDIFVFYYIIDITNKQKIINEKELLNIQANNQILYFERIKDDIDRQRSLSHEYNNQLECINTLLSDNNLDELKNYMSEVTNKVRHDSDYIDTNNAIVNAVINTKYYEATEKDITFIFFINDLSKLTIDSDDLVILLANSLNNAIEACQNCKDRVIKLKIVLVENELIISVSNTYNNVRKKNNEYLTTKSDYQSHGFGIKNMERIVDKNDGIISVKNDEKQFYLSIMIPQ